MSNEIEQSRSALPTSLHSRSSEVRDLIAETLFAFETKAPTSRIAFSTDIQFLDVRAHRSNLKQLKAVAAERGSTWVPGLLFPIPNSDGGRRSVEIHLIADNRFQCVGFLRSRYSTKFFRALDTYRESGVLIPIIGKVVGLGKSDSDIELMSFAKTNLIDFVSPLNK